jgi:hypothetical protein
MPISQPRRLSRNQSITQASIICWPSHGVRRRCLDHDVQGLTSTRTGTTTWGHTRRVIQQSTRGKHRHMPPAAHRRFLKPTTAPQARTQRQVIRVGTDQREVGRDGYSTPNFHPLRRQLPSSPGSMSIDAG